MSKGVKVIKLDDRFKEVIAAASGENIIKALKAGGEVVRNHAKLNIQAQELVDTSNLLNSISVQEGSGSQSDATVEIGTNVEYAAIHEFGGAINQTNAWGKGIVQTIHIPARPYLRPALDENEEDIKAAVGQSLVDQIKGVL
jgi:HK97 gp10 family phage protein